MRLLAVNFHYIAEEGIYPFPGIYPTPKSRLKSQLEVLGSYFTFISQAELVSAIQNQNPLPQQSCIITFDDGLKQQYQEALPILDRLNIPAVFFACGLPYREKKSFSSIKYTGAELILIHKCLLEK